jgi:YD repeat-containing protein
MLPRPTNFWRPPWWKWVVFLALLAVAGLMFPRPAKVELLPFTNSPPAWDGSYPYLVVSLDTSNPNHVRFTTSISILRPTTRHESAINQFQVDLHSGMFVLRQTDLFIPDVMPLALTRTYRPWDDSIRAFGVGANHPSDICPTGTRFPYTYQDLNLEDGRAIRFPRISKGTGYADAVFRHDATDSEFYGAQDAWNGNGWTLKFQDGRQFIFPEAYFAKTYAQGAAIEMRDAEGNRIQLRRDKARNLEQLISPSGRTITFKYDSSNRIIEATGQTNDGVSQTRQYSYVFGHLQTVSDGMHVLYRFDYERLLQAHGYDPYLMTSIRDGAGKELLRNWYTTAGLVLRQRLADGSVVKYDYYLFDREGFVEAVTVTLPNGKDETFHFNKGIPLLKK